MSAKAADRLMSQIQHEDHTPREVVHIRYEDGTDLAINGQDLPTLEILRGQLTGLMAHGSTNPITHLVVEGRTLVAPR